MKSFVNKNWKQQKSIIIKKTTCLIVIKKLKNFFLIFIYENISSKREDSRFLNSRWASNSLTREWLRKYKKLFILQKIISTNFLFSQLFNTFRISIFTCLHRSESIPVPPAGLRTFKEKSSTIIIIFIMIFVVACCRV